MGLLAIGFSMNFGLANTIVQERAPSPLRGRISAVFGLSFFGLMPIAGLGIPGRPTYWNANGPERGRVRLRHWRVHHS